MTSDTSQSLPKPPTASLLTSSADGNLLILLIGALYALFTLSSSNQAIVWPWVALWQATLILPIVWLLWQVWYKPLARFRLSNGFDWLAGLTLVGLLVSTLAADFPKQAVWYGVGILGGLAALYGLMGWLTPSRVRWVLKAQAYLAIAFMASSLGQWWFKIYRPELQRLEALRNFGLDQSFSLNTLGLRNWYPLGHQNYVGGYLLLVLPLLVGLALTDKSRQRWLWSGGVVLGLLDLYTTNSRGATLGLLSMVIPVLVGILRSRRGSSRWIVPIGLAGGVLTGLFIFANPRLRSSLLAVSQGDASGGQISYRIINNVIGWNMGQARPWAGMGPGSVLIFFQQYRPFWAGREAELHYQLHSTPAQLWAELGLWGILLPIAGVVLLGHALWRRRDLDLAEQRLPTALLWSLITALWGYGVLSLTDYQLDVVAITGVSIVFLAVILFDLRAPLPDSVSDRPRRRRLMSLAGLGLVLALVIWLIPVHRAWATSAKGFGALQKNDVNRFVAHLEQAHQLAPWEPYYPFQLGWVLGDLSYRTDDPAIAERLRADAIRWLQQGNEVSPYQEFGHSNQGWLEIQANPEAAIAQFAQSAHLIPAKVGVFYGLGGSLFLNGQRELAIEAIALELLRNPMLLPNLPLNGGPLTDLLPAIVARVETLSNEFLESTDSPDVARHLHQVRGAVRWWTGDFPGAEASWNQSQDLISLAVLKMSMGEAPDLTALPDSPGKFALLAWQEPENRQAWLEAAWLAYRTDLPQLAQLEPPEEQIQTLLTTMNASATFDQWIKENAPYAELRAERIGFGVLMRHDDGVSPSDFYIRRENLAMSRFFETLLPSPDYLPKLEQQLQPYRLAVLEQAAS